MQKAHPCFHTSKARSFKKVLRVTFRRRYTGFTRSYLMEVEWVQHGGQKQSSGSKKANGCAGNHVEKDIKCSQTLMSTGPDSWHCTGRTVVLQVYMVHESCVYFSYFEFLKAFWFLLEIVIITFTLFRGLSTVQKRCSPNFDLRLSASEYTSCKHKTSFSMLP